VPNASASEETISFGGDFSVKTVFSFQFSVKGKSIGAKPQWNELPGAG
jgi:hypothetical protein